MAALGAGDDAQVLLLRLLVSGQHLADARPVDAHRLLGEEVLAGLDGRLDVLGPEAGRGGQHHQVTAVDDLLIGVEADEAAIVGDIDLILVVAHALTAVPQVVLEHVAQGIQLDVVAGAGRRADVVGGAAAPAAAADQADLDHIAARRVRRCSAGRGRWWPWPRSSSAGSPAGWRKKPWESLARSWCVSWCSFGWNRARAPRPRPAHSAPVDRSDRGTPVRAHRDSKHAAAAVGPLSGCPCP